MQNSWAVGIMGITTVILITTMTMITIMTKVITITTLLLMRVIIIILTILTILTIMVSQTRPEGPVTLMQQIHTQRKRIMMIITKTMWTVVLRVLMAHFNVESDSNRRFRAKTAILAIMPTSA